MKVSNSDISDIAGFSFGATYCGIKKSSRKDLSIAFCDSDCAVAGTFTNNKFAAAPVIVDREKIKKKGTFRGLVVNSGNANACTGKEGIDDANLMCELVAKKINVNPEDVLVCSTGLIGQRLPMGKIRNGISKIEFNNKSEDFVEGIMTTDRFSKQVCLELKNNAKIAGVAKGAGMIHPNMATMLCFLFTDAKISKKDLEKSLKKAVEKSFNMISVDGDTSTNDTVLVFASQKKGNVDLHEFQEGLEYVTQELAKMVVKDGEGATKLMEVEVTKSKTYEQAKKIVKSVINSTLVKCALFGEDPNWGRIVCALGYSGSDFNTENVSVKFGDVYVFKDGKPTNNNAARILKSNNVKITIELNEGKESAKGWGCDLTNTYVNFNSKYHT